MGDGTKENPYTREDVLRLIEENGGKAEGLNLSRKVFEEAIDLRDLDLRGIMLNRATFRRISLLELGKKGISLEDDEGPYGGQVVGARLSRAHLEGARLAYAHLEDAKLLGTHLERATLIEAHLDGADLSEAHLDDADSWMVYFEGADLLGAHLPRAGLNNAHFESANLRRAHLEEARLGNAHFEGADLSEAHLEGADLSYAHLEDAKLLGTHFERTYLSLTEFSANISLEEVDWGNYILGEEKEGEKKIETHWFREAEDTYRRLKQWYTNAGVYDVAGEFFFREMEVKRKRLGWLLPQEERRFRWRLLRGEKVRLNVYKWLYGYGERPWRVVAWGLSVLLGSTLIYFFLRGVAPHTLTVPAFLGSLYYSAVSFTALGYGPWFQASSVRPWVQGVGAAEAIIGVFTIALFLITFVRKMTR